VRIKFRLNPLRVILASLAAAPKCRVTAGNDADDLRWIAAECRRAFGSIEHTKPPRCAGTAVKEPTAGAHARNECVDKCSDRRCCVMNAAVDRGVILRHDLHLLERCAKIEVLAARVALFRRDMTAIGR
jgi:hypothetical protein